MRDVRIAGIKEILLSEMAKFCAEFAGNFQIIVDNEADVRAARDGQDFLRHGADLVRRGCFGAKLDQIAAAIAKFRSDEFGRAATQVGRVHEGVESAIRERFHFVAARRERRVL